MEASESKRVKPVLKTIAIGVNSFRFGGHQMIFCPVLYSEQDIHDQRKHQPLSLSWVFLLDTEFIRDVWRLLRQTDITAINYWW